MKKLKLSLSICMMCLCVAVLCMGILAASSATYQINGNISYNMIDGVARVNARVYKVAGTGTLTSDQLTSGYITTLQSMELENISKSTSPNYILTETKDTIAINQDGKTVGLTANIVYGANTDQSTYYTYFIVLNITNQSSDTGYVLNAYLSTLGTSSISNIASNSNGESNKIEIKSGEFSNIVIGLSYKGTTTTSETFSYTLSVLYEESGLNLKQDTTNSYWYVELGQVSSSDTTKLKWRLVSLDGSSAYTYSATQPTVGSGSVFVQETALTNNSVAWGSSKSDTNYFTESTLRTSIKDGDLFSLTTEEQAYLTSGYIKARTLPNLSWSYYVDYQGNEFIYPYTDSSHSPLTSTSKGTDYFWLMSVDELYTYFESSVSSVSESTNTSHSEFMWKPSGSGVSFWLRSPCYYIGYRNDDVLIFGEYGRFFNNIATISYNVRAAFQLT